MVNKPIPKIKDNEWFTPQQEGFKLHCCDCGLIHVVDFKYEEGTVDMRMTRITKPFERLHTLIRKP